MSRLHKVVVGDRIVSEISEIKAVDSRCIYSEFRQ